jgi:hypothetical protein
VLRETNGIVAGPRGAAVRLGLKRTTLLSKMEKLGISPSLRRRHASRSRRRGRSRSDQPVTATLIGAAAASQSKSWCVPSDESPAGKDPRVIGM